MMGRPHESILVAGTCTVAYGFNKDGMEARAAGVGPVLGDWGRLIMQRIWDCYKVFDSSNEGSRRS
ncbi:putative N-acetyl-D-glucosamine kinase isoform X1 [Iris pallida]|uniref:N-acetyl-D-glucosamine kinase isoform X1 n=1 Tax=Iris pallida TaxID=29817 RepID=A0AAX6FT87_IRIPA|nr:putative N-acetyl-D-glucosamine kinase isoform X1 [Iris pallida]